MIGCAFSNFNIIKNTHMNLSVKKQYKHIKAHLAYLIKCKSMHQTL